MKGLSLARCDLALPPAGTVPDWVHLLPAGLIKTRDGRQFELPDPSGLILDFQARGIDLPVDYEHQNDRPEAKLNGPVPAAGWIKELKADASGLWGRVEWTATAREVIGRREYRYLSPSFLFHPESRQIMRLKGAGLVHNPALYLKALASEENNLDEVKNTKKGETSPVAADVQVGSASELLSHLAKLLGLPSGSDAVSILKALVAVLREDEKVGLAWEQLAPNDPTQFMPVSAVKELLADRNKHIATMRESDAKSKVEDAISAGHITPGMRQWAIELCVQSPESFDTFVSSSPAPYAHLFRPTMQQRLSAERTETRGTSSQEEIAICTQLGLAPGSLTKGR